MSHGRTEDRDEDASKRSDGERWLGMCQEWILFNHRLPLNIDSLTNPYLPTPSSRSCLVVSVDPPQRVFRLFYSQRGYTKEVE